MRPRLAAVLVLLLAADAGAEEPPPLTDRAIKVHDAGLLFDGHNDLPWWLREHGDVAFAKYDLARPVPGSQTDIPRLRRGGVKAQF